MELLGIVVIVVGFMLSMDTIFVVLAGMFTTALIHGIDVMSILDMIGTAFTHARYTLLFFLALPIIGGLEKNGLREVASNMIGKIKSSSAGGVISTYFLIRAVTVSFYIAIGGFVQMVRPIIYPMALGSTKNKYNKKDVSDKIEEMIKADAIASENMGNFFAQNIFVGSGGVLLIVSALEQNGIHTTAIDIAKVAIIPAIFAGFYLFIKCFLLDRKIQKELESKEV